MMLMPPMLVAPQTLTPQEFLTEGAEYMRYKESLRNDNSKRLLIGLERAPAAVRHTPAAKLARSGLKTIVTPPKTKAGWIAWMRESERLDRAIGEEYTRAWKRYEQGKQDRPQLSSHLLPLLIDEVRERHPNAYTVAYSCAYSSDGERGEGQWATMERLARKPGFPFWRLVGQGLPQLAPELRENAFLRLSVVLEGLQPAGRRERHLRFARRWLTPSDYQAVVN